MNNVARLEAWKLYFRLLDMLSANQRMIIF
jgi:hypothetical protein